MKTYKLKKDTKQANAWTIFKYMKQWWQEWVELLKWETIKWILDLIEIIWIDNEEFFEEINNIEEIKLSKFRVWDYVVFEDLEKTEYIKIFNIIKNWRWKYLYNYLNIISDVFENVQIFLNEDGLRRPTEEELKLYFR